MARVVVSVVVKSPVEKVWRIIRDFNALPRWHPLIAASRIEDDLPPSQVGCVRNIQLAESGETIREQLLGLSDVDRACSYNIVASPLEIEDYVANLRLVEITEGNETLAQWQAEFRVSVESEDEIVALVRTIFREGLLNLNEQD